jgi:hypothetical protein
MAHQILVVISSDSSEYVEEDDIVRPAHSNARSSPSVSLVS